MNPRLIIKGIQVIRNYSGPIIVLLIIFIPNAFPFYQWLATDGFLFYSNAYDETAYLTYDVSLKTQSLTRVGQFLVTEMHHIGFSGGAINLSFDLLFPLITVVLVSKIFIELKFPKSDSYLSALLILSIPILFGRSNPFYSPLLDFNISSGAIQWVTMPEAYYPPLFRSPEPQVTLALAALAVYVSVKKHTFIPLYLVTPFLYPFVRIPFIFVVMVMHVMEFIKKKKLFNERLAFFGSAFFAYAAIGLLIIIYQKLFVVRILMETHLIQSRIPLISMTGIVCILLFLVIQKNMSERFKPFLSLLAISPFISANTQIITGVIAQPNNFEQYYGTVCISLLAAFGVSSLKSNRWMKKLAGGLGVFLILVYSKTIFSVNSSIYQKQPLPTAMVEQLNIDSSKVVVDNVGLASALNLVLPMQKITGLAMTQNYALVADDYFNNYLCLKRKISKNIKLYPQYKNILERLGEGYRYLQSDFIFIHINRRKNFKTFFDPDAIPNNCPQKEFYFYSVNN